MLGDLIMVKENVDIFRSQHTDNYIKAIKECIKKNTDSLVFVDIMSIIDRPPLDSMDVIKNKFLELAKRNKVIVNIDIISDLLEMYRSDLSSCCNDIMNYRNDYLFSIVSNHNFSDCSIFVFYKKDFLPLNKSIKSKLKDYFEKANVNLFNRNFKSIFKDSIDVELQNKYINDLSKFLRSNYKKKIVEMLDMKLMVKDTTLINTINEQSDRYKFTLNNSHLLNDFK